MQTRSSVSVTLVLKPRGKPLRGLQKDVSVSSSGTPDHIYQQIAKQTRFSVHRLRLTLAKNNTVLPNAGNATIASFDLRDQDTILVKDLGPQLAWRTVFLVEYLGPIVIHGAMYAFRQAIYSHPLRFGAFPPASQLQTLFFAMIVGHFIKRELETVFVHRFSLDTMPAFNIFKNSAHYWILAGANIAYWTYSPNSPTARPHSALLTYAGIAIYLIGEAGNFAVHITLRNLRRPGSKERNIPKSLLFTLVPVTCPNYFFEILAWLGMWMINLSLSTGIFIAVAALQMAIWAKKKEKRYRQDFGAKYTKKRYAMIPGII